MASKPSIDPEKVIIHRPLDWTEYAGGAEDQTSHHPFDPVPADALKKIAHGPEGGKKA